MILSAIAEKLKRRSKNDFKGRHFEASLILQAVSWDLRYALSYRDIEELFLERGLAVDHATVNRWVLAYAPLLERRLRAFRKPHCGSIRIDETYIKIRGQWRYLYRAIDKHGTPVDFLLTAKRDLGAAKRFFRKMLKDQPLLAPDSGSVDAAVGEQRPDDTHHLVGESDGHDACRPTCQQLLGPDCAARAAGVAHQRCSAENKKSADIPVARKRRAVTALRMVALG